MMTKEEIQEARMISQEAVEDANNAPAFTDEVEAAVLLLPRALDALEAANREIERLQKIVDWGDGGNSRALPSLAARAMERAAKKRTT